MWSRSELETALVEAGLGEWAARLAQLAKHSIILVAGSIDEAANAPVGPSRLGGAPDLPPDVDWPTRPPLNVKLDAAEAAVPGDVLLGPYHWLHRLVRSQRWKDASQKWKAELQAVACVRGRTWPLSFVAQVDFAELHAVQALEGFPSAGRLLLFCDPFDLPWGKQEDQARARVIFLEVPAERLERRPFPTDFGGPEARRVMPRGYAFKSRLLRPEAWLLPPPQGPGPLLGLDSEAAKAWAPDAEAYRAYEQFWCNLYARHPQTFGEQGQNIHQVGGVAVPVQAPVEEEAARLSGADPAKAPSWRLVLQIDSDIEAGMELGDGGRLYVCLRDQDLRSRQFDRSWTILQTY